MLTEQAPEDLQVRGVLHPLGEDRLRSDRGLLLRLGERDGRELYGEVGEQDHLLHCQCLRARHVTHDGLVVSGLLCYNHLSIYK